MRLWRCPTKTACVGLVVALLAAWPTSVMASAENVAEPGRIRIDALVLVVTEEPGQAVQFAIDQLAEFCRESPKIAVRTTREWPVRAGVPVLVGRSAAQRHAAAACETIRWDALEHEGFVLHAVRHEGANVLIAAGAADAGTRLAIYALMCEMDVGTLPASLPAGLSLNESPSFQLRGMYAHQHWAYRHPYALRTWTVEQWKRYVDMLAIMRVNLFQIWSMAGILSVPFSAEEEAFLRRYPPVIDHARKNHGMTVWIGECANNVCERRDLPPPAERDYFEAETLKNPADPAQMDQLRAARAAFYKVCDNADGYWVIDSDPGKWPGSPSREFVDILMMNRELINAHTRLGGQARLVYWMWFGWGTGAALDNWRDTLSELVRRSPEPWWMTVAGNDHWKVVDELGVADRVVYYPYGNVEPEPSLPFTTVMPDYLCRAMEVPERIGRIRGVMGNAQTPLCQLPNIHYFASAAWNMNQRSDPPARVLGKLARLIYPEHADLLTRAWLCLRDKVALDADALAEELQKREKERRLGRPGPIGLKLFPDYGQIARDLSAMLQIHSTAMRFCRRVEKEDAKDAELFEVLKRYCILSLAWRRQTGFQMYGTNGANFFPLREAVHRRWWRDHRLDPRVYQNLADAMKSEYSDEEAHLILYPLSR